eukprot:SAG31_NODE_646_length_13223_cov_14.088845_2_plen_63_part_00
MAAGAYGNHLRQRHGGQALPEYFAIDLAKMGTGAFQYAVRRPEFKTGTPEALEIIGKLVSQI